jgi:hypothetical protein
MAQIKEPPLNRAKRMFDLNAPRISDSTTAEVEQLLNDAIQELVFAIHHSQVDELPETCARLVQAQRNITCAADKLTEGREL